MVRTSRGFRPTYVKPSINTGCVPSVNTTCITDPIIPTVTADIKTNAGNVCEYWDASCHIQQGVDSISEGIIQAGENITTWGDEVTVTIQESYVENIETPIVKTVENVQDAINKAKKDNETYWEIQNANYDKWVKDTQKEIDDAASNLAKNTQDAFNATIKATQEAASDVAAAAGKGVVKPLTDMMMISGVAVLGIGLLLVMKK